MTQRSHERRAKKASFFNFSIQMCLQMLLIVGNRRSASGAYIPVVWVVSTACRTFNRKLDFRLLVTTVAPRTARSTIRHFCISSYENTQPRFRFLDLLGRRLRRCRSFWGGRRLGRSIQSLRCQRNRLLRRRRGSSLVRSFLGLGQVRTTLLAGIVRGLVERSAFEAFDDGDGRCWSVAHSCSSIVNKRCPAP